MCWSSTDLDWNKEVNRYQKSAIAIKELLPTGKHIYLNPKPTNYIFQYICTGKVMLIIHHVYARTGDRFIATNTIMFLIIAFGFVWSSVVIEVPNGTRCIYSSFLVFFDVSSKHTYIYTSSNIGMKPFLAYCIQKNNLLHVCYHCLFGLYCFLLNYWQC